jgi:putative DNA primase/helicase
MRTSALTRQKYDRNAGAGVTYLRRTIAKAIARTTKYYAPRPWPLLNGKPLSNGKPHLMGENNTAPAVEAGHADDEHLTDVGNARRVVARHGADLQYVYPWRRFLTLDSRRWAEDETGAVVRMVKDTQAAFYREAAGRVAALGGDAGRKAELAEAMQALKHAVRWEDAHKVAACVEMVKSEPGVAVLPADLDCDPFVLNVLNGTLDLRTGQLRPHRRDELLTKLCRTEYRPDATCPQWDAFLYRVMDRNWDLITYLQRVVGYALTGDVGEQVIFFFHGSGANGKSTLLGTVKDMLGDYGCQAVSELLMAKAGEAHPTERADLFGRRFVCTIETDDGKRMAESLMKQLTGGDAVKARRLYQDLFEFTPTWKLFLSANHKPTIRGSDHAVWRRIKLVPFTVTISDAEKDKDLPAKLRAEWPGILAWAVRGCLGWQRYGLGEPEEVRAATDAYRAEQDTVAGFVNDCCFVHPSAKAKASSLFEEYVKWSGDKLMTQTEFGKRFSAHGFERKKGASGWFYHGVGVGAPGDSGGL